MEMLFDGAAGTCIYRIREFSPSRRSSGATQESEYS